MPKQPESKLQLNIRHRLEAAFPGSWWFKVHGGPFQKSGVPDHVGCVMGLFFALEVKRPGERASVIQEFTMASIRRAGGVSCVVLTPEEAIAVVKRTLRLVQPT